MRSNTTPRWQLLCSVLLLTIGALYALPNLYSECPVIQITPLNNNAITPDLQQRVATLLQQQKINYHSLTHQDHALLVHFSHLEAQRQAQECLENALSEQYTPTLKLLPMLPHWFKYLGAKPLKLGLDLRGGVRFLLAIDMERAMHQQTTQLMEEVRHQLRTAQIPYQRITLTKAGEIILQFATIDLLQQSQAVLEKQPSEFRLQQKNGTTLHASLSEQQRHTTQQQLLQHCLTILRKRVNVLGISEPLVQSQGTNHIVVELPGIQESSQAKALLGSTTTLEMRLVNPHGFLPNQNAFLLPRDTEHHIDQQGRRVALYKQAVLSGTHIQYANATRDEWGRPQVNITLDNEGGRKMATFSQRHIGQPLATLLIEYRPDTHNRSKEEKPCFKKRTEIVSIAHIESQLGRHFRITGLSNMDTARHLALLLRTGTLNTPLQIIEERIIGPTLGKESIQRGLKACGWGLFITILFMVGHYRLFGLIAISALLANLILLIGILSMLPSATLTLPGIAGIILTIGMAVDANVLIFERIKEEYAANQQVQLAIHAGYRNAFSSIADANLTTLITAVVLYMVGSGAIKGFALILAIGLATSMFTAIICTRIMVNYLYGGKHLSTLSI